jgi:hypothetical protein
VQGDDQECAMARVVVKCRYTGNYILTGVQSDATPILVGGRVRCPYCSVDHVWIAAETDNSRTDPKSTKPIVRLAS